MRTQKQSKYSFDRSGHSHFKKCIDKICDKNIYPIIHLDEKFLIFGNINSQNEMESNYFQIFIINKETQSFLNTKIKLPKINNIKNDNQTLIGNCFIAD